MSHDYYSKLILIEIYFRETFLNFPSIDLAWNHFHMNSYNSFRAINTLEILDTNSGTIIDINRIYIYI